MNTPDPAHQPIPAIFHLTPSMMLDHLIDVLVHPNPDTCVWLEEMITPTIGSHGADERITEFAHRAAKANVALSLTVKMVAAIIKAEGWIYSPKMAQAMVHWVYRNHLKLQDEERCSKESAAPARGSENGIHIDAE